MPQFVIERDIPNAGAMTADEIRAASLSAIAALRDLGPEIRWVRSFVTEHKIYCIYFAPDPSLIEEHARRAGLPVDRVAAVRRIIDPVNYEG